MNLEDWLLSKYCICYCGSIYCWAIIIKSVDDIIDNVY